MRALAAAAVLLLAGCSHMPRSHKDPLSAEEHAKLGAVYESQGLKKEALAQYRAAVERDARYAPGWMAIGNRAFEEGDWERAEKAYKRALKAAPRHAGAQNNLAMCWLARGVRIGEAERLAREALSNASGSLRPFVLDTLASIYRRQGRYREAGEAAEKAAKLMAAE